jgi:hypothetical protein
MAVDAARLYTKEQLDGGVCGDQNLSKAVT